MSNLSLGHVVCAGSFAASASRKSAVLEAVKMWASSPRCFWASAVWRA